MRIRQPRVRWFQNIRPWTYARYASELAVVPPGWTLDRPRRNVMAVANCPAIVTVAGPKETLSRRK